MPDATVLADDTDALRHLLTCARCLPASGTRDALRVRLREARAAALERRWQVTSLNEERGDA